MATKARAVDIPRVLSPSEAADILGMTTDNLSDLINRRGYSFFAKRPGGKPGDRGRNRWGLTEDQLRAIVKGETRHIPKEDDEEKTAFAPASPDGRSRLKKGRLRV